MTTCQHLHPVEVVGPRHVHVADLLGRGTGIGALDLANAPTPGRHHRDQGIRGHPRLCITKSPGTHRHKYL
jgi:hypothetical protein